MNFLVVLALLTLGSTSSLAAIQTVLPTAEQQLSSCTIERLVWQDDGSPPLLGQIGMIDVVLMQGNIALRTLATVDALDLSAAVLLPCELPAASDYRIEYIPHSSIAALSSTTGLYRRATTVQVVTSSPSVHRSKHAHTSTSTSASGPVQPHATRAFDLMTPAAPMMWQTTSSPATPQSTLTLPPTRAAVANRAMPSRGVGVHPGLIVMWVGVMCSMLVL
ncbi:hypothetical protein CALVIDRAFT_543482 [Calocera viscosa TUFC12733]|uniref:Uncharacterized protein n=1 Tax=Calocera viscosa (strain TUFC12733) TaxID=1330018 RepID=A0A167FJ53_CALVF|nr:hypothetical protein CALVIDRAFT_543482 [Calocera viscosa TUFC12733]